MVKEWEGMESGFRDAFLNGGTVEFDTIISTSWNPKMKLKGMSGGRNVKMTMEASTGRDISNLSRVSALSIPNWEHLKRSKRRCNESL